MMDKKVKILIFVFIMTCFTILYLEFISRKYASEYKIQKNISSSDVCEDLRQKYGTPEVPDQYDEILKKRELGQEIEKEEYITLADGIIKEVEEKDLKSFNGISCGKYCYVSKALSVQSKKFVKRHELAHTLGELDEFKANKEASSEYFVGYIQTIVGTSFSMLTDDEKSLNCRFVNVWTKFKDYMLP
jgi:hypothetical protein